MTEKARRLGLQFRPHFKTHQSAQVAEWFRETDTSLCTVSSLQMAEYFSLHGWKDILISTPVNPLQIEELISLASLIRLSITVCDEDTVKSFERKIGCFSGVYIKTDTGYGRAGINWEDFNAFSRILKQININGGNITGFLVHDGHTYSAASIGEIEHLRMQTNNRLRRLKMYFSQDFPNLIASAGDTPSCCICSNFEGIDEIRPGNFVFFDLMQLYLKSCNIEQLALKMICPVVSVCRQEQAIIHCGAVHLSKESINIKGVGRIFGKVFLSVQNSAEAEDSGWITSLSQEHGIVKGSSEFIKKLHSGAMVIVIPVHSCLSASACGGYYLSSGGYVTMMK